MTRPPRTRRPYRSTTEPTWTGIAASTAVVVAVPVLLWIAANPLAGGAGLALAAGVALTGRRALRLHRCLQDCGGFAVDLADDVRVCVARPGATEAC